MSIFSGLTVTTKPIASGQKPLTRTIRTGVVKTSGNEITIIQPTFLNRLFRQKNQTVTITGAGDVLVLDKKSQLRINSETSGTLKTRRTGSVYAQHARRISADETQNYVAAQNTQGKVVARNTKGDVVAHGTQGNVLAYGTQNDVVAYGTKGDILAVDTKGNVIASATRGKVDSYKTQGRVITDKSEKALYIDLEKVNA